MKFLFDMFPILLFFAAYYVTKNDIFIATGVTIAATAAQVAWMWLKHRKGSTGSGAPRYTSFSGGKNPIWNTLGHERMGWAVSTSHPATP